MSLATNEMILRWYYDEALSTGNLDRLDALVSEDFVDHEQLLGIPSIRRWMHLRTLGSFRPDGDDDSTRRFPHQPIVIHSERNGGCMYSRMIYGTCGY